MSLPRGTPALIAISLLTACQNQIWLSEPDAQSDRDAGRDASVLPPRDANQPDGGEMDAGEIEDDAALPPDRDCELATVPIVVVGTTGGPLETPSFAASGRLATLRYAVLVPPSASLTPTDDTQLVVLDDQGAVLHERTIRLEDASGVVTSLATLHSLSSLADEEGFLMLTPRGIWMLDADGAGASETATLTAPPSAVWQRSAGWLDADRFAFVSDTTDLRLAVFDRRTGEVQVTSISALNAAGVHLDAGGATISSAGPASEAVVYDPDLSGTETLRITWDDGSLLGPRLLGVGLFGGERTWLVNDPSEFRTNITSYLISPGEAPVALATAALLGPLTAAREGSFLAITSETPALLLYGFEDHMFSMVAMGFAGAPLVEDERDGENVSVVFFEPIETGRASLELACGRP